jgi:hypothetical protein
VVECAQQMVNGRDRFETARYETHQYVRSS